MADRARDPETLEREIARTRAELARTIDALADRVNPKNAVRRSVSRLKDEVDQVAAAVGSIVTPAGEEGEEPRRLAGGRTIGVAVGAGVVLSVTAAVLWRRRRRH
jgi:transcription initiation factor TFIIIB Brf1 subunit/transcription initiation factor TFIIB